MKFYILAFGCQFNKADAEKISQWLESNGDKKTAVLTSADLIIILMCSVRQKSVDKVRNKILVLKQQNPRARIVLSGCVLKDDKKLFKSFGIEIKKFRDLEKILPQTGLVVIGKGCNNFCSYCVVPYTRGREKYRSKASVIKEVKSLVKKGVKEITLLAQNVNSYPDFAGLLKTVTDLPGDFKLKFITNHPKDFSDELIKEMAANAKIIKYVHLPFQAGDNEILRKMNRKYTRQDYLKLIAKIRKAMPGVVITTDIIVGFPGETKRQFQHSASVMNKVGFRQAFIAKYSPRPGTASFRFKDDVPPQEKIRREQALRQLINVNQPRQ